MPSLGYRLRIRNADDTADELVLSSVGLNIADEINRPFLTAIPTVDGASADLVAGTVDVGTSVWTCWDEPADTAPTEDDGDTTGGDGGTGGTGGDGGTGGGDCASRSIVVPLPNGDLGPTGVVVGPPVAIGNGWFGLVGYAAQIIAGTTLVGDEEYRPDNQRPAIDINVDISAFGTCRYHIIVTTSGSACLVDDGGSALGYASGSGIVTVTSPSRGLGGATYGEQHIQIAPAEIGGTVTITSVTIQGVA